MMMMRIVGLIYLIIILVVIGMVIYGFVLFVKLANRGIKALDIYINEKNSYMKNSKE
ncbi:hypothetical protein NNC19_13555 [Clostridium sp. SHJSY1]|uniref:hypothetical protein n=1 Tax=Clostridium sp. SHJSY1 TaxID=2942483 RepID=UPI002875C64A|nr:hypothetical protein [Clostridium sp. SHJSY1]MDS0526712.1 hypothetical protein [Clostridium sp. SHJSY1]